MTYYTINWLNTNVDGNNTIHGPDGDIDVSVSTPQNDDTLQWAVQNGILRNGGVTDSSPPDITFSKEVTDVTFTLLDVDSIDDITIMTRDADGNPVAVEFESTGFQAVSGNVVASTQLNGLPPDDPEQRTRHRNSYPRTTHDFLDRSGR